MFYSRGKNHLGFSYGENSRATRKDDDSPTFNFYPSLANANNLADLGAKAKIGSEGKHDLWEMVGAYTHFEPKSVGYMGPGYLHHPYNRPCLSTRLLAVLKG